MTDKELVLEGEVVGSEVAVVTPMAMIESAVAKGTDVAQLTNLFDLQERYEKNEAKKAYTSAMNAFKANPPTIHKDKDVSFGGTSYSHASLANIVNRICVALSGYGLRHNWSMDQTDSTITVTCTITHELGHSESVSMTSPFDNSGKKNVIQSIASANTYLQRYTILAATGLAVDDGSDDDGMKAEDRLYVTEAQAEALDNLLEKLPNPDGFLKFYNIMEVEQIQQRDYAKALDMLERKVRKAGA